MSQSYDAILVVSFGGPEGMGDVMPFLSNVLRGRNVPESRMREVAHHYELFGGVSPINEQNRRLIAALGRELGEKGPRLPVYWGNRNWHPMLADTLRRMRDEVGAGAPQVDKLRAFFNPPGFVGPNAESVRAALAEIPEERRRAARL